MIAVQGDPANPASPRFRQTDGASGNSSPHMKMQFKIITASAPGGASLPIPRRLSSLGGGGWEPQPLEPTAPSRAGGRDTSGPWSLFKPSPELSPHPKESEGVRKGSKESSRIRQGNSLAADGASPVGCSSRLRLSPPLPETLLSWAETECPLAEYPPTLGSEASSLISQHACG